MLGLRLRGAWRSFCRRWNRRSFGGFFGLKVLEEQLVGSGRQGDSQDHSQDTEQSAAQSYCGKHPDTGQADGVSHHLGVDDVALDLL